MRKNGKKGFLPGEYIIAALLAAVIIFGVWFAMRADEGKRKSVDGTYSCEYPINGSDDKSIVIYYKFDAEKGTLGRAFFDDRQLYGGKGCCDACLRWKRGYRRRE